MDARKKELMENQLRLVMIDRMLKEKYNEISYLAIQPPKDPDIVEINRKDLDWLLGEQRRCESLEEQNAVLEQKYLSVVNSRVWRWGSRISKSICFLFKPVLMLRQRS